MAGADATLAGQAPALTINGAVATITLRRPQLANRLELADLDTLLRQVAEVDGDGSVRVLRLQAEGRQFCSGFNVSQVGDGAGAAGERFEALAEAIEDARPVTIAALQGGAYGGAVDLALACDFRIGTPEVLAMVPAARLGLHFYRGGLERMVQRLGLGAAKRLLLAAETLDATGLLAIGWLDRIVDAAVLADEVERFAQQLAAMAPLSLLPMKRHLGAIARGRLDAQALADDIARALASDDLREGGRAWAERRAPVFVGR